MVDKEALLKKVIISDLNSKSRDEVAEIYKSDKKRVNRDSWKLFYTPFQIYSTGLRMKIIENEEHITPATSD